MVQLDKLRVDFTSLFHEDPVVDELKKKRVAVLFATEM